MSTNPYDFFDDIVCINLETVPERRAYAQEVFDRLDIPARFFTAKKHPKGGRYGCFDSHVQVIRQAYDSGVKHLLVFEDDLLPTPGYSKKALEEIIRFLQQNQEWDIFYLGYSPYGKSSFILAPFVTDFSNIIRFSPLTTHAMCYNQRSMKKVLDNYHSVIDTYHYDIWLSENNIFRNYCYLPMLFEQTMYSTSNIPGEGFLDIIFRIKRYCLETLFPDSLSTYYYTLFKSELVGNEEHFFFWIIIILVIIVYIFYYYVSQE